MIEDIIVNIESSDLNKIFILSISNKSHAESMVVFVIKTKNAANKRKLRDTENLDQVQEESQTQMVHNL